MREYAAPQLSAVIVGPWPGSGQYGTPPGGPVRLYAWLGVAIYCAVFWLMLLRAIV
jgi:hypothetical protein